MPHSEIKNAPPLYGWSIAVAAGAVAAAVSFLLIGIEGNGSVLIGAVITLVVGAVFTIAETPPSSKPVKPTQQVTAKTAATPAAPIAAPAQESDADAGVQPQALEAPVGTADDLKQISGVGPVLERKLNDLGIYHFWQIAGWSAAEVAWVDGFLNFKGRIARDEWLDQASKLAASSPSKPLA
ncbi:MAG: NADH:ubiquinone oxidoreductase [Roseinatronobacter sp.]|nr:MAG: NADH:ubiquinone oxidoreductase [Roseinatronobacter sp.]